MEEEEEKDEEEEDKEEDKEEEDERPTASSSLDTLRPPNTNTNTRARSRFVSLFLSDSFCLSLFPPHRCCCLSWR